MAPRPSIRSARRRQASVLLLVLIVVSLLTLAGLAYFDRMFAEHQGARMAGQQAQAQALAESGVEYLKAFLAQTPDVLYESGGIYDNPARLRGALVLDGTAAPFRGRFSVLAPGLRTDGYLADVRYGVEDESARLNLNMVLLLDNYGEGAARNALLALPGMTESIADAILDWIDTDDETRPLGAERDYYSTLQPPYQPQNGPLETIEQLLLVRDVTPELLLGVDANRNGLLEEDEAQRASELGLDDPQGALFRGWDSYLTVHSAEKNVRPDGSPKIDVNMDDLQELSQQLQQVFNQEQANFIVAFRQGGPYDGDEPGQGASAITIDYEQEGRVRLDTVLDLVGTRTRIVPPGEGSERVVVETPFREDPGAMRTYLPLLMENLTTNTQPTIPGRLNINQAPRLLLNGLPDLPSGTVDRIISQRDVEFRPERPERAYATWLLSDGILELAEMKKIMPLVTGGGSVYRAQVVGYFDQGPASRVEVVLDATKTPPAIVHWRELDELGPGYSRELLGVELDIDENTQ